MTWLNAITYIVLFIMAITDIKKREIPDSLNILLFIVGCLNVLAVKEYKIYLINAAVIFIFFFILAVISNGSIGGGDIKLFSVLSLIYGIKIYIILLISFLLAGIAGIILKVFCKKNSLPLAPFILIAVIFLSYEVELAKFLMLTGFIQMKVINLI